MSRSTAAADKQLGAEVREIQKATAVLACIQCTVEYENDVGADLAVVRAVLTAVAARIVTGNPKNVELVNEDAGRVECGLSVAAPATRQGRSESPGDTE